MNCPKCEEIIYRVKAQPQFNTVLIATENILKIEAGRPSKLNQLAEGKNKDL